MKHVSTLTTLTAALVVLALLSESARAEAKRPNILWISAEDISPDLGCYVDKLASTPNLDKLASEGTVFRHAFTHAGVCAVVRSGVITGVFPVSIGSHHMRSNIVPPPHIRCFTEYLRAQGYYCTNRSKTDYNFASPVTAWDRNGPKHDDWRGRAKGQPFFAVVNLTVSHESQARRPDARHAFLLRRLKPDQRHDPDDCAEALPPYIPDTPAARKNWAKYYDNISEMDRQAGEVLARLKEDGLENDTLVVFWGDHGQGLPRGKRWIYDSGTHVPLLMRFPGRLQAGSSRRDLVSILDLPPTMLSVAGVDVPKYMHGRVLVGENKQLEPKYLFFHRDRMDEAYELMRAVRDHDFKYIRNFEPEKTYAQGIDYMDLMPAMREWRRLHREGKLVGGQRNWFAMPKPIEELYDLAKDPHELVNLAAEPEHRARLREMRKALEDWQIEIGDLGLVPEPVLMERMRPGGKRERAATPTIELTDGLARIRCSTKGASLAYAIIRDGEPGDWKLYTGPVELPAGAGIRAVACRLGFRESQYAVEK